MDALTINPVQDEAGRHRFLNFPWELYQNDNNWVPPLYSTRKLLMNSDMHPFYKYGVVQFFVACRGAKTVGTIAAITNRLHNEFHNDNLGFFGFFDCYDDSDAAHGLLSAAEDWTMNQGHAAIRGPVQFTMNDECGLLAEGFDSPPKILMPHNPHYYPMFFNGNGYRIVKELIAYKLNTNPFKNNANFSSRVSRIVSRAQANKNIRVRKIVMKKFDQEVEHIQKMCNEAFRTNWGFVPITDEEASYLAETLRPIVDPNLVFIAEVGGENAGFSLTIPDINEALLLAKSNPNAPEWWTLLKLIWFWKLTKKIYGVRVFILCVVPKYRNLGIETIFYYNTAQQATSRGFKYAELSWALEDNNLINNPLLAMGSSIYKKYQIYEKSLLDS